MKLKNLLKHCLNSKYIIYRGNEAGVKYEKTDIPKEWYAEKVDVWWAGISDDCLCVVLQMEEINYDN